MSKIGKTERFEDLIRITGDDKLIKKRILDVLQLSSFERRSVLNHWLEELRLRKAPQNLMNLLSCLFDDTVANTLLTFLKPHLNNDLSTKLGGKS
jgi:hypothetical protein